MFTLSCDISSCITILLYALYPTVGHSVINSESTDSCSDNTRNDHLPRIQIRSVLVRCPNKGEFHIIKAGSDVHTNLSSVRTQDLLEFFGYDTDEPLLHSEVTNCRQKLVITIQMANCGLTKLDEEFVLIDQVYDPVYKQRIRLLNPMVFKIKQHQVEQSFGLNIQHIVNAEATEEVINKNNASFKGCQTSGVKPTCGYSFYHEEIIPYSEGFCCSCDPYVNVRRQPDSFRLPQLSPIAFSSREGQYPQGSKYSKHKCKKKEKRRVHRTIKEAFDEIYADFAAKIKSFMFVPIDNKSNEVSNNTLSEVRSRRCLLRHSPKYYNIPPMQPAKGFSGLSVKSGDNKNYNSDPWEIALSKETNLTANCEKSITKIETTSMCRTLIKITKCCLKGYCPKHLNYEELDETELANCLNQQSLTDQRIRSNDTDKNALFPSKRSSYDNFDPAVKKRSLNTSEKLKDIAKTDKNTLFPSKRSSYDNFDPAVKKRSLNTSEKLKDIAKHDVNMKHLRNLSNGDKLTRIINPYPDPRIVYPERFHVKYSGVHDHKKISNKVQKNSRDQLYARLKNENPKKTVRPKRQITASGNQIRGGQSCLDRHVPRDANPQTYHESAHCLRFSELWYNVYRIKAPFISHKADFQLFEKHSLEAGDNHWEDLTQGLRVQIGTFNRHMVDHATDPSFAFTYTALTDITREEFCLDPAITTLLVPRPVPKHKEHKFPQVHGGPKEYLLVRSEDVSFDGEDCNKAGVSFKAFAKQQARCEHFRGTCLQNQPLDLWRYDKENKRLGEPGKYFLENYAKVSDEPIKFHKDLGDFLSLDFTGSYISVVEIEVPIDRNGLVRSESAAQLSEIYIDSTCDMQTRVTVLVTNTGLTSSPFYPRLKGCPPEVPQVWTETDGPIVYVAPQKVHKFRLSLYGRLPVSRFHCSIELLNKQNELVATRRIRIQKNDRCICMWHCLCSCIGSVDGLACDHMSLEHYHAAGFSGSLPVDTTDPSFESQEIITPTKIKSINFQELSKFILHVYIVLLFLGFLKLLLGFIFPSVFNYGMWLLFESEAKCMTKYKESYWALTHLVKDCECFPISPSTKSRQIQILSRPAQMIMNIFFFCIFPGIVLLKLPCAVCYTMGVSMLLLKNESLKTEWIRKLVNKSFCKVITRFCRRSNKALKRNCLFYLCCLLNPLYVIRLCKKKKSYSVPRKDGDVMARVCRVHKIPMKKCNDESAALRKKTLTFEFPRDAAGNVNMNAITNRPTIFRAEKVYQNPDIEALPYVPHTVKSSEFPDLDKKIIRFVIKSSKKGFHDVMNQVMKKYKAQRLKKDSSVLYKECEEMRNKLMENVINSVTKIAFSEVLKQKTGDTMSSVTDNSEIKNFNARSQLIAEQIVTLIENCFQELINKKLIGTKFHNFNENKKHYNNYFNDIA